MREWGGRWIISGKKKRKQEGKKFKEKGRGEKQGEND